MSHLKEQNRELERKKRDEIYEKSVLFKFNGYAKRFLALNQPQLRHRFAQIVGRIHCVHTLSFAYTST